MPQTNQNITIMAKFKVTAEIYVEGSHIRNKESVREALRIMLGCYDDMDDTDTSITISPIKTEKL